MLCRRIKRAPERCEALRRRQEDPLPWRARRHDDRGGKLAQRLRVPHDGYAILGQRPEAPAALPTNEAESRCYLPQLIEAADVKHVLLAQAQAAKLRER